MTMAPMRMLLAVLFAAAIAVGWLLLRSEPPTPPITGGVPQFDHADDQTPVDPMRASRARLSEAPVEQTRPDEREPPTAPVSPAEAPTAATDAGKMHVRVLDRASGAPVEAFRFVLRRPDRPREDRAVPGAEADLQMPIDRDVRLRIEADGFEPQDFTVRLTPAEPERRVRVELERAVPAAGIEIRVQTPDLAPVTHLQVHAARVDPTRPTGLVELWHRRDEDVEGHYRLPEMSAGTYSFDLQAVTETGAPLPFLTHTETIEFGGAESIARVVQLQAGALVELEVRDAGGALLGTDVLVRILHPALTDPAVRWLATIDGQPVVGVGGLPGAAAALTARALPPGTCTLQARRGDGPVIERVLTLHAGGTEKVVINLPN